MSKTIEITGTKWSVKYDNFGNYQPHYLGTVKKKDTEEVVDSVKALQSFYPNLGKALEAIIQIELYEAIPNTVSVNEWLTKYYEVAGNINAGVQGVVNGNT